MEAVVLMTSTAVNHQQATKMIIYTFESCPSYAQSITESSDSGAGLVSFNKKIVKSSQI